MLDYLKLDDKLSIIVNTQTTLGSLCGPRNIVTVAPEAIIGIPEPALNLIHHNTKLLCCINRNLVYESWTQGNLFN